MPKWTVPKMVFLLVLSLGAVALGCFHAQPLYGVQIENRLDSSVDIAVSVFMGNEWSAFKDFGKVNPNENRVVFGMGPPSDKGPLKFHIMARLSDRQVVWNKEYSRQQIEDLDSHLVIAAKDTVTPPQ